MSVNITNDSTGFKNHLDSAVFASRLQPQYPQSLRNHHLLLPVVRRRYSLKEFEAFDGSGTTSGLVWEHTTDGFEEDAGRSAVMEWTGFFGIDDMAFVEEVVVS